MIVFDQLRISDDGKLLYIDAHVNKSSDFDNITLDSIIIQKAEQVSEMDPLTPGSEYIYSSTITGDAKELHLCLKATTDFEESFDSLSNMLLFIYITCKGTPGICTPCRLDEMTTLGVTFDESLYYQKVMQYTKELVSDCSIPDNFIDLILLWNGFKAAVETEHYMEAIKYYNKMFRGNTVRFNTLGCGCHG